MAKSESASMLSLGDDRYLNVDLNEPGSIVRWIGQTKVPFKVDKLNTDGHSDYMWETIDGLIIEVERKTYGEIVSALDAVEEQLQRHLLTFPDAHHVLLLEGFITSSRNGIQLFRETKNGIFVKDRESRYSISRITSWLYEVSRYVSIVPTTNPAHSATTLVSMFKADGKTDRETLVRPIANITRHPDPTLQLYMSALKGIGETRARALKKRFPTLYDISRASVNELASTDGIGKTTAESILKIIGSPEV